MTIRQKQARFWIQVSMVFIWAAKNKMPLVLIDWDRTIQEQKVLVARGASKRLDSAHIDGLAVDVAFLADLVDDGILNYNSERYRPIGEYAESVGLVWGGRFGAKGNTLGWDCGHLEYNETIIGEV